MVVGVAVVASGAVEAVSAVDAVGSVDVLRGVLGDVAVVGGGAVVRATGDVPGVLTREDPVMAGPAEVHPLRRPRPVEPLHAGAQLTAARGRALVVVAHPRQVQVDAVHVVGRGGDGEGACQILLPLQGEPLLLEHQVEPVAEEFAAARPVVVRGDRRGVQRPRPPGLGVRDPDPGAGREVVQQRLHHVPRRHLGSLEAGPHPVRVTGPEHPAPPVALIETGHELAQIFRELPDFVRELSHCHRRAPPPGRLESAGPEDNTRRVTGRLHAVFRRLR
ncbi:hypothetical protein STRAU_7267 [Streptomyces aurantiacus JA 4570]|uniref:Uncharacterized protein n=1 Tax=Streptomyces aurantiacus JA 4570 TaxID=1286094 RepID=S3Z970_9ACTN|nr:hypothetical protein STRAU_7267 [Streptomyces aurantiacus JA 4570]